MHHKMPYSIAILGALLLVPASPPRAAYAETTELAAVSMGASGIQWRPLVASHGFTLTVAGTDQWIHSEFEAGEMPVFQPFDASGQPLSDGAYTWELRIVRRGSGTDPDAEAKGRPAAPAGARPRQEPMGPITQSGAFVVRGGAIVSGGAQEEAPARRAPSSEDLSPDDFVIADDLIVQGSTCTGFDCVNNEDFGSDTLRLKENNLQIHFDDTSTTPGFPNNDWRLIANDSDSGGRNIFKLEDSTANRVVFAVEAGARANSLYVGGGGRVGIGTSTPVLDLHVQTGNTPALRLDQDGSSGFTPQTWDVAGNEANFFVRDVTGGSRLPLRIRPGALTSSVDISPNGVGIGTASPAADLDVRDIDGNGAPVLGLKGPGKAWTVRSHPSGELRFAKEQTSGPALSVTRPNHPGATLDVKGPVRASEYKTSSSRALKTAFEALDPQEVLAQLAALPVSVWRFKWEPGGKRHVGPMAEDFQRLFGLGDGESIATVDADGVLMAAVQGLKQLLDETRAAMAAKDAEISRLASEISRLEAAIDASAATSKP